MTLPPLEPYGLPPQVADSMLNLAQQSDVLLFGEFHGTQEVPRLLLEMLDPLAAHGYRGLALELPTDLGQPLVSWANQALLEPPPLFGRHAADGRESLELLALVRKAVESRWHILCFDAGPDQPAHSWAERDMTMAHNFAEQWERLCPGGKIIGVCGNLHSRLEQMPAGAAHWWPSFAHNVQQMNAASVVSSIVIWFHGGTYFNDGQLQDFLDRGALMAPEVRDGKPSQHSSALHLPSGTAATFLARPSE